MSIEDFWNNVQRAANLRSPRAVVDSPRLDAKKIESIIKGATRWLTPKAVEGYDAHDFGFLSDEERAQLTVSVEQFKSIASEVSGTAPATTEQIRAAAPKFARILEILRPDKYADLDAFVLGKTIETQVEDKLPEWVREMVFETGSDVSGAPALWIWVEVADAAAAEKSFHLKFALVRETLEQATSRICPERWPYIRLRTESEQRPVAPVPRSATTPSKR